MYQCSLNTHNVARAARTDILETYFILNNENSEKGTSEMQKFRNVIIYIKVVIFTNETETIVLNHKNIAFDFLDVSI